MSVMSDTWIRQQASATGMIEPFVERQQRAGNISYGLSSYGYDARVADEFKIFTNVNSAARILLLTAKPMSASFRPTALRWPARWNIFASRVMCW
jgi:deoxycytidine triphosphate deaminase